MLDQSKEEMDDFDLAEIQQELDYLDRYERETLAFESAEESKGSKQRAQAFDYDSDDNEVSRLDEDLDPEFRDQNNEETV